MEEIFIIITFPAIQEYQDHPDFDKNASLINDDYFINKYGSSAYFVNANWLDKEFGKKNIDMLRDDLMFCE